MPYVSCPSAVVDTPVNVVWGLLLEPTGWGNVFDLRVLSVDPPGPAVAGQEVRGETGLKTLGLELTFRMIEIDPEHHRLRMDVHLPFGLAVREDLRCTPLDATHCQVDYRCDFGFPRGWRGTLLRLLLNQNLASGPEDSLSRLKRVAERGYAG